MGARGLLNYIRLHRDTRSRSFSLASIAHEKGGEAIIICDFICVIIWLLESFHEGMVKARLFSRYSHIYGADFDEYAKRILQFVEALQHIKIRPVFFVDGPRGSTTSDTEAKLQTWLDGQRGRQCATAHVVKFCQYDDVNCSPLSHRFGLRSLFLHYTVQVLQKNGVEVIICNGEADRFMAECARENPNVCGILTWDTDLTMMAGCSTLHCKFFDREDTLKLRLPVMNVKPGDIRCETIEPDGLARSLGIHVNCLPALSILCGNDYTKHYTENEAVRSLLKMTPPYVEWAANWIQLDGHNHKCRTAGQFLSIPEIRQICDLYPHYRSAVAHSYRFYGDSISPRFAPGSADVHSLVPEILCGKLSMEFLSIINCSVYWNNSTEKLPDDKADDDVCAKLLPVRKCMYSLLCLESVTEYGLHHRAGRKDVPVQQCPASFLRKLRTSLSPEQKMMAVCVILISQDQLHHSLYRSLQITCDRITRDHTSSQSPRFNNYVVSLLVYASIVQAYKLSVITEKCLVPALLTCLCSSVAEQSPKMTLRPTPEAVVCASRVACIVEHAYYLASLLGLHSELPLPSEVFKASTYVPFHMMEFKSGKCHGEDEKLQSHYKGLSVSVLDMGSLKILVKCGDEAGITAFDDKFGSSQAHVKEFLTPSAQPPRKVKSKSHRCSSKT